MIASIFKRSTIATFCFSGNIQIPFHHLNSTLKREIILNGEDAGRMSFLFKFYPKHIGNG